MMFSFFVAKFHILAIVFQKNYFLKNKFFGDF